MHHQEHPWYQINNIASVDSPALVIYLDRVKKNIQLAIEMIGDVQRLRPHVKTHKSPDVTRLMMEAGITKFKCATIAEADMLGTMHAPDVLLAYQLTGPKIKRFTELVHHYPTTKFSCLVDNVEAAQELNKEAIAYGLEIPVFIDLNIGMNRTGIFPDARAIVLFEQLLNMKGIKPIGFHAYDGHITDPDFEKRSKKCNDAFEPVTFLKKVLWNKGHKNLLIVAGGSPTFPIHLQRKDVECSPGTFVYWDAGYQEACPEQSFLPAALVISRIVSLPGNNLICTDLGHKAIAAENPLPGRVQFINAMDLECISQSEEHLVLKNTKNHSLSLGDVLYGMPMHICPTCALYERICIVEDNVVMAEWKITARDRKIHI